MGATRKTSHSVAWIAKARKSYARSGGKITVTRTISLYYQKFWSG